MRKNEKLEKNGSEIRLKKWIALISEVSVELVGFGKSLMKRGLFKVVGGKEQNQMDVREQQ